MIEWLRIMANKPVTWLVGASLLIVMPLLLFGSPGFYGDDLNALLGVEKHGVFGAVSSWMHEYGVIYRPIGIILHYSFYDLFQGDVFLFYLVYISLYVGIAFVLHRQIFRLTADSGLSIFSAIFFLLFPFNPTAFWQLPSISMILTCLFSIKLACWVVEKSATINHRKLIVWSAVWLVLLLSYEQVVGLSVVIALLIFIFNFSKGFKLAFLRTIFISSYIFMVSLLFIISYTMSQGNPKIITLQNINKNVELIQTTVNNDVTKHKQDFVDADISGTVNTIIHNRLKAINERTLKGLNYIYESVFYGFDGLVNQGFKGLLLILMVFVFASLTFFTRFKLLPKKYGFVLICVGIFWVMTTMAPFFLYKQVHVPPYTLMIPSIGLGLMFYGIICVLSQSKNIYMYSFGLKGVLFSTVLIFSVSQYGYYFGLREELSYWGSVAKNIEDHKLSLKNGYSLVLHNVPAKKNSHIFWMESLVGYRYLSATLGEEFPMINIQNKENDSVIILSLLGYDNDSSIDIYYKNLNSI